MCALKALRPQFYESQYLGAEDLDALVRYFREARARHALGPHTWGIAAGLKLKEVESPAGGGEIDVYVTPGFAWDGFGRTIVVMSPYRIPISQFSRIDSDGPVPVWLRYRETETQSPAAGFGVCSEDDAYRRVKETYEIVVGRFRLSERRDDIVIGGDSMDAREADSHWDSVEGPLCDASVAQQDFAHVDAESRWLIPLGYVTYEPGDAASAGRLVGTTDEATLRKSRALRVYAGAVAENLYAADGIIRLRERSAGDDISDCEKSDIDTDSDLDVSIDADGRARATDLVWVEGSLRAEGDIKLFDTELGFRTKKGENTGFSLRRVEDAGKRDLEITTGDKGESDNRLLVGPLDSGSISPVFTVRNEGLVGVGTETPDALLHVSGADTAGLKIDSTKSGSAETQMLVDADGRLGLGTESPEHMLQIGDASEAVGLALRGPDLDAESSYLAFEDNAGTGSRWFKVLHDTDSNRLAFRSDSVNSILSLGRTTGDVGLGTDAPEYRLEIHHDLSNNALSIGTGGDKGRISTAYRDASPALIFYDRDDCGGVLRFRESPSTDDESSPEYEATVAGRRGRVGINTLAPQAALDVNGDIRMGSGGSLHALAGPAAWRVVVGHVDGAGNELDGDGFTCNRDGEGEYTIGFDSHFPGQPIVTATLVNAPADDNCVTLRSVGSGGFKLHSRDVAGGSSPHDQDSGFMFIAIGPR